jgi:uncharacterized membrane protein affecting hemolysin expression
MDFMRTMLTLMALAGLCLAVGLELRRSRRHTTFLAATQRGGQALRTG